MLSDEVTIVVIVLGPADSGIPVDAEPEGVALPLTVILAVGSLATGVTLIDDILLGTAAV